MKSQKLLISLLLIVIVLALGGGLTNAQDTEYPSLRDLASQNDVYIGSAAWTHHLSNDTHAEIMAREFNMFTPEHEAKWCMISNGPGEYDFSRFDELMEFAESNDMVIHGHTLVWHSCSPNWVENAEWEREEAIEVLRNHITTVVERYKGRIKYWDVVNEAWDGAQLRDTAWLRMIGEDYIELAFQFAHEADPDALLLYNDYGGEPINRKSDAIYEMAQDFVERGIPIHGIGMQAHLDVNAVNHGSIAQNMERIGELGLEVQLTEVDIKYRGEGDERTFRNQARDYYLLMETCLDAGNCTAFIVWGVSSQYTWLREADFFDNPTVEPLLWDDNYEPKPAYFALLDILARRVGETPIFDDAELSEILGIRINSNNDETASLPDVSFSDDNQLAPDSVDGVAYYAPLGVTIELDGDLSDWENIPRVEVTAGTAVGDGSTFYEFAAAADDTNFYYMVNVTDSNVIYGARTADEWWQTDSVEFYINATGDLETSAYDAGIAQFGILAENTQSDEPLVGGSNSGDVPLQIAAVETETGYVIEVAAPLESDVWSIEAVHEAVIGFQSHLNGSSSDSREVKLIWSAADTQDQSWNNPSLFGQLIFWDNSQ